MYELVIFFEHCSLIALCYHDIQVLLLLSCALSVWLITTSAQARICCPTKRMFGCHLFQKAPQTWCDLATIVAPQNCAAVMAKDERLPPKKEKVLPLGDKCT